MATREIFWNVTGGVLIYAFAAIALLVLALGIRRRLRLWRLGRGGPSFDRPRQRLGGVLREVLGHRRQLHDPSAGVAHLFVFYGFLALFVASLLIAVQEWSGIRFLQGDPYRWYSLLADLFGLLGLVGLGLAIWRRGVRRPPHLHTSPEDWIALALLLLLFVQGFLLEGTRIAVTELRQQPELARWSPGGRAVALLLADLDAQLLRTLHRVEWWMHAGAAIGLIAYLGYGKLAHLWYGLLGIFFRNLETSGRLRHPDVEALLESDPEALEHLGVGRLDRFAWKDLLDLDACMNCGRCEAVCPAHQSGVALNPRKLIRDLRAHLGQVGPVLLDARAGNGAAARADLPPLVTGGSPGAQAPAVLEEEIWGCRTCGACQHACPVHVEHVPKLVDLRRHLVMTVGKMGAGVQQLLRNLDDRAHPFSGGSRDREAWLDDLAVKRLGRGDRAEWLFWVGCAGALVDRNIRVSRALVKVLDAAGIDFAVLGAEERCTGDPARRVGGELTYQTLARENVETLNRYGVRKIVTACPHCLNTLKNEYPDFGGRYEVLHHTQLVAELVGSGRLRLRRRPETLTYHDPCYLGRHNGVYEPPRQILSALAGGGSVVELERRRSASLCCGAGGGYAWMDDAAPRRINRLRFAEVQAVGAATAAVSCPFCLQMFDEAGGALDPERAVRTADVAELAAEALEE